MSYLFLNVLQRSSIRIVADCGTQIFQVTTKFLVGYNVNIHYCLGYYLYTLLADVTYGLKAIRTIYKPE
jgi:hypothetical protein